MNDGYLVCSFDMLNVRDLDVIEQAAARCRTLVVGVLPDEEVARVTGRSPVVPLDERAALVSHIRGVRAVVPHGEAEIARRAATHTFFSVLGDASMPGGSNHVVLTPTRQTSSVVLRDALGSQPRSVA